LRCRISYMVRKKQIRSWTSQWQHCIENWSSKRVTNPMEYPIISHNGWINLHCFSWFKHIKSPWYIHDMTIGTLWFSKLVASIHIKICLWINTYYHHRGNDRPLTFAILVFTNVPGYHDPRNQSLHRHGLAKKHQGTTTGIISWFCSLCRSARILARSWVRSMMFWFVYIFQVEDRASQLCLLVYNPI
jgi:hypothetical protein